MDRSRLFFGLTAALLSAALVGCEQSTPDQYRTYEELQSENDGETTPAEGEVPAADPPPAPVQMAAVPTDASQRDEDPETANAGDQGDRSTIPLEPELTPEPSGEADNVTANGDDEADPAVASDESEATTPVDISPEIPGLDPAASLASRDSLRPEVVDPAAAALADVEAEPAEPRQIELLVPDKTFKTEGPEGAIRVSYDDIDLLKVLNMEPVPEDVLSHFPHWLSDLDETRIRIRGFMYPTFQATGLGGFVLARDNEICCFGRNPKIYDLIEVSMRDGVTTDYIQGRPFDVVGVFHIRPEWDADEQKVVRLYQIDDAIVIDR